MGLSMKDTDSTRSPPRFPGASPPRAGSFTPRRLYRDPRGPLGGVAAGLAAYFEIDPVIVRLLWIVGILAGLGIPAYFVCWAVVPRARSWPPPGYEPPRPPSAFDPGKSSLTSGLVIVALAALIGSGTHGFAELLLPAALLGFGIYLLNQRAQHHESSVRAEAPVADASDFERADAPDFARADAPDFARADAPDPNTVDQMPFTAAAVPGVASRQRSSAGLVTPTVLSLLALGAGVCWVLNAAGVVQTSVAAAAAAGLVVVGAGLVASLWLGRAPGLIPVGIGLAALTLAASKVEPWLGRASAGFAGLRQLHSGPRQVVVGDHEYRPLSLAELRPEYALGFGNLTLDLAALDLAGSTQTVDVKVGAGNATVIVPREPTVEARGEVGIGEAHAFDVQREGLGNSVSKTETGARPGTLRIHFSVGAGEGTVRHAL
jgi:phage shock protein PspC (stress-responsive transcriptional regulator)